jgi:outer membrane protein assembly factor BamB
LEGISGAATDAAIQEHPDNVDVRIAAAKGLLFILGRTAAVGVPAAEYRVREHDSPWWRGYHRNGHAPAGQSPPRAWSRDQGIVWSAPVPGRGHGSATIVGNQVLLAVADVEAASQSVYCFDREQGKLVWNRVVHQGKLVVGGNEKSSHASCTPACDGERIYVNFLHADQVHTTALTMSGDIAWQTPVSDFVVHQGYGASPALYDSLVITSADHKGGGAIVALDRKTGKTVWQVERPAKANYTSPIILHASGRDQLFLTGCDLVTSLDPRTGTTLWETPGATTECVTSTVTDGVRIFSSGGYPENHIAAIRTDGSTKIEWKEGDRVYVPSLIAHDQHLYGVLDAGVAQCWKSDTGETKWRERLGGTFSSSPVLVNGVIYVTNEAGTTFIYRASPDKFELLGKNQLGDECFATPVICGNRIYVRVAFYDGTVRSERLFCIGTES